MHLLKYEEKLQYLLFLNQKLVPHTKICVNVQKKMQNNNKSAKLKKKVPACFSNVYFLY